MAYWAQPRLPSRAIPGWSVYWPAARRALSAVSLVALPMAWVAMVQSATSGDGGGDAYGYWMAWNGGLYDIPWHGAHAFVYTPPIGLALWPFGFLPWPVFYGLFTAAGMAALVYLVGLPWAGIALITIYPVSHDLADGNIHLLMAAAIVAGRWWFPILTKVTPAIGLAYYVAAGRWRSAMFSAGSAAALATIAVLVAPGLWVEWFSLAANGVGGTAHPWALVGVPLLLRLPIALLVAGLGGHRRWQWTIPVATMLALPVIWVGSPALLLAIPAMRRKRGENAPACRAPP